MEENSNKYILGIIGIVAVVGTFMFFMNAGSGVADVTGNAVNLRPLPPIQLGEKYQYVSFDALEHRFGQLGFGDKSPARICRDLGYMGCLNGYAQIEEIYYSTLDGNCGGFGSANRQYSDTWIKPISCDFAPGNIFRCSHAVGEEPSLGDMGSGQHLHSVMCIK